MNWDSFELERDGIYKRIALFESGVSQHNLHAWKPQNS